MNKRELEIEQIFNYIKKNNGVSVSEIHRELSFAMYLVREVLCFLLGAEKIKLYRKVGTISLYVGTKQVIKDAD